jgi:hypothetical protein
VKIFWMNVFFSGDRQPGSFWVYSVLAVLFRGKSAGRACHEYWHILANIGVTAILEAIVLKGTCLTSGGGGVSGGGGARVSGGGAAAAARRARAGGAAVFPDRYSLYYSRIIQSTAEFCCRLSLSLSADPIRPRACKKLRESLPASWKLAAAVLENSTAAEFC